MYVSAGQSALHAFLLYICAMQSRSLLLFLFILFFVSCGSVRQFNARNASVNFLHEYIIPDKLQFQQTTVGGLSGIDYDKKNNVYYVISDDRSNINPARFYTFSFHVSSNKIENFTILRVDSLRQANGDLYPNKSEMTTIVPDPESIRLYTTENKIIWSSEGERIINEQGNNILNNPAVHVADKNGRLQYTLPIPRQFVMSAEQTGPRRNGVFEGISFTPDEKFLFVSTEEPLYQDGSNAKPEDGTYWCRIIKYDFEKKKPIRQYAYPLDRVIEKPIPATAFSVNGISEILALDAKRLLVVERSFSMGRINNNIRIYLTDLSVAEDISENESLISQPVKKAAKKTLLFSLDKLGTRVDNIEGITFGPVLSNGNRSLILVSDNNFIGLQKTQILLFDLGIKL